MQASDLSIAMGNVLALLQTMAPTQIDAPRIVDAEQSTLQN
jgi:hypothetical protein